MERHPSRSCRIRVLISSRDSMSSPAIVKVDAHDLRKLFNDGRFVERARLGELAVVLLDDRHPSSPRADEPYCTQVGICHYRSTPRGRPGALSRCPKASNSSSDNPARLPTAVSSDPSPTRPSWKTMSTKIARASASMLRPCRAARTRKARCTSSGRLRTVSLAIVNYPSCLRCMQAANPPLRIPIQCRTSEQACRDQPATRDRTRLEGA